MASSWTFAVARNDLARTTLVDAEVPALSPGEVLLRVDRVGLTANNVTYAVLGESFRYWEFFPPAASGLGATWGLVPLWGFAQVAASTVPGVEVGQRLYGYLPPAGHLVVRPDRVDRRGFRDASPHRAVLPSPYNNYALTTGDEAYQADREDLQILYRPLFFTSFMLADQLQDDDFYGAQTLVLSSASSRTAYAAAFELQGKGPRLAGLTSPDNVEFTRGLGCYDEVRAYDEVAELDAGRASVYLDFSGRPQVRERLRAHLGGQLLQDIAVGLTSHEPNLEAAGSMFFAPNQMRKRTGDWGRAELDARFAVAWHRFAGFVETSVQVSVGDGPRALRSAWLEVLDGATPPRVGHVIAF